MPTIRLKNKPANPRKNEPDAAMSSSLNILETFELSPGDRVTGEKCNLFRTCRVRNAKCIIECIFCRMK